MSRIKLAQIQDGKEVKASVEAHDERIVTLEGSPINKKGFSYTDPGITMDSSVINLGSLYGVINIDPGSPVAIRYGETNLAGRHSVIIINTSDTIVYVGFDTFVSKTNGIPIAIGQERVFSLNPTQDFPLYAFVEKLAPVRVIEVK